eukprot:CAMPEP_0202885472 /NCGR_PEP_ID=MMETSP1391-20130828/41680_1 /ASSEMBLY_ACC=CAM_ASM_000867 /TAXON_ID=1034604 /ORGANISM="Chlamydomonas leiostraca, Strain SAG 11-49" /LENGTH=376 /DNA_ID=CAMNT_0049568719 /DNA_START=90 /DNA_END=1220 /DNA_ORIENTATION=-
MASLKDVGSQKDVDAASSSGQPVVLHFWASWCEPCKHMDTVMAQLAKDHPSVTFMRVEAEAVDEVTIKYEVAMVPAFVLIKGGKVVEKLEGADPAALSDKVQALAAGKTANGAAGAAAGVAVPAQAQAQDVQGRIKWLLAQHPVLLFMKGTADSPSCGFSSKVVAALRALQVPFKTVDILADEALRTGLKEFSSWPTYPQLYVKGELVGGCDIVTQMQSSGELAKLFSEKLGANYQSSQAPTAIQTAPASATKPAPAAAAPATAETKEQLQARLKALVSSSPVMLFMKGTPEEPRCGFSRKVVDALRGISVQFGSFDILGDSAVREGLKELSSWPTYPQLYVKGELLGGCDIVLQMQESGELKTTIDEMLHRMDTA